MENNKSTNYNRGLLFSVVGVLTLIVAIAGATYAFFQATATNNDVVKGTAATSELKLEVSLASTNATGNMVPQLDSAIQSAVTGASGKSSCIDANNNTICKVYTIKVTNNGTSNAVLTGKLTLTAATMSNLKWTTGTSATAGFSGTSAHDKSYTTLASSLNLAPTASQSYYVVVWISETNSNQNDTDKGSFSGSVTFNSANGKGVTSTITG